MIGICSTACLGNNKVIICDFENQKDISQWQKRATKPPVKWTLNTDKKYISSGKDLPDLNPSLQPVLIVGRLFSGFHVECRSMTGGGSHIFHLMFLTREIKKELQG